MPRPLALKIGGGYVGLNLTGANLNRVKTVSVVASTGEVVQGFDVRLSSRNRTDARLALSLLAGNIAVPGSYLLRLTYQLDDPMQQTTPGTQLGKPGGATRLLILPAATVTVRATAMNPRIIETVPATPRTGVDVVGFRVVVTDVPGQEVVSITYHNATQPGGNCYFQGSHHSPELKFSTAWQRPHVLEIIFSPGQLLPYGSSCRLMFTIHTRNQLDQAFASWPERSVQFLPPLEDTRVAYPVANTTDLARYLKLKRESSPAVGICDGHSIGLSGSIPVGAITTSGDMGLKARSGPIGTQCTWMVYADGLRDGWEMRLTFKKNRVGDQCDVSDDSGARYGSGSSFTFSRLSSLYQTGDGVVVLSRNSPNGIVPDYLTVGGSLPYFRFVNFHCAATLSNDHEAGMRIVSAELFGPPTPGCDWKCGVSN